jgi:hypothetical protein
MSITFRCEHCRENVKAPDEAAGKRGKCPHCGMTSYIPDPNESGEIPLAPIDEQSEAEREAEERRLREQEEALIAEMGGDPDVPIDQQDDIGPEDLHHYVVNYCLDMAEGKLEPAQTHADKLKRFGYKGLQAVDDFLSGNVQEPAMDEIPPKVVQGFLDQLREQVR